MTGLQLWLLALQGGLFIVLTIYLGLQLYKVKQQKHKYRLYSIRDKLLYLVASGVIKEESFLFKTLYSTLNATICEVQNVTLWSQAKASVKAKALLQQEEGKRLIREIEKAPQEAKEVMYEFSETMMDIAKSNSLILMLLIQMAKRGYNLASAIGRHPMIAWFLKGEQQQYHAYRYFEQLRYNHATG